MVTDFASLSSWEGFRASVSPLARPSQRVLRAQGARAAGGVIVKLFAAIDRKLEETSLFRKLAPKNDILGRATPNNLEECKEARPAALSLPV